MVIIIITVAFTSLFLTPKCFRKIKLNSLRKQVDEPETSISSQIFFRVWARILRILSLAIRHRSFCYFQKEIAHLYR